MAHRRLGLAALVLAPVLAGCGGTSGAEKTPASPTIDTSSPTIEAPSPTVAAATGVEVPGTGYSFRAPTQWRDVTKKVSKAGVDTAAAAATATAGFTSNINVVIADRAFTAAQLDQVTERARSQVDGQADNYQIETPTTVAGALAGHLRGTHEANKASYWLEQYLISHGKHTYVVSFSFSPKVPETKRDKQIASVLASWTWG